MEGVLTMAQTSIATLAAGMSLADALSSELAARVGERVMFRTQRRAQPEGERALLERARFSTVSSAYGRLPIWRWGNGPGVLLVHGWNGRGAQLGALVEPLVHAGYEVVTFDAPGHGLAEGRESSLLHFADAIETVIDAVRPVFGPLHAIVTHSMGGPATVYAMSRFQRRSPLGVERELREAELPARRFALVAPPIDVGDFIKSFASATSIGVEAERLLRRRIEHRFGVAIDELYAPTLARRMDAPALVIHDADDREVPASRGRTLADAWPGAELHETRGLGHVRILRDPGVVDRIVRFVDVGRFD
jgi:pimeloyl-ACP methyl ester carboxylesterase